METTTDRKLHMGFSLPHFQMCSNSQCKESIVPGMHETAKRLLDVGLASGARDFVSIARLFGASDQSATNWKSRGVPKTIMIEAAQHFHIDVGWLACDPKATVPAFVTRWKEGIKAVPPSQAPKQLEQAGQPYLIQADEQTLLDGYRVADSATKRALLLLAKDALAIFGKRSQNHQLPNGYA